MHAVAFFRHGGPDVLEVAQLTDPAPGAGEIRIRVAASTVNPADTLFRSGALRGHVPAGSPPFIGGLEVAGTVDAVGAGTGFSVGDPVVAYTPWIPHPQGGQAELVVRPARAAAPAPATRTLLESATLPMNGLTARYTLDRLGLRRGATIAVTGAAGAVGGYALQLAAIEGIRAIAVVAPADEDLVRALGADAVVPRGPEMVAGIRAVVAGGVDAVIDAARVGDGIVDAIRDGGAITTVRASSPAAHHAERGIRAVRVNVQNYYCEQEKLIELVRLVDEGSLSLRVARRFAPDEAAEAHRIVEAGGIRGRIVISFGP